VLQEDAVALDCDEVQSLTVTVQWSYRVIRQQGGGEGGRPVNVLDWLVTLKVEHPNGRRTEWNASSFLQSFFPLSRR
jgi:hypothetical protein